ncbi:MAG: hypothetical protein NZ870_01575 [bacterium]|nr:hypothetical protein [bacterium]
MRIRYIKYRVKKISITLIQLLKKRIVFILLFTFILLLSIVKVEIYYIYPDKKISSFSSVLLLPSKLFFHNPAYKVKKLEYKDLLYITLERKKVVELKSPSKKIFTDIKGRVIKDFKENPDLKIDAVYDLDIKEYRQLLEIIPLIRYNILNMQISYDYIVIVTSFVAVIDKSVPLHKAVDIINSIETAKKLWIFNKRIIVEK